MNNQRNRKRVVVYIDSNDHRTLKSKLALLGLSVSGWFRKLLEEFINEKS